jgi:hypothetical protein
MHEGLVEAPAHCIWHGLRLAGAGIDVGDHDRIATHSAGFTHLGSGLSNHRDGDRFDEEHQRGGLVATED